MKMPWSDQTGLAKGIAFFATLLAVSFGLCGVNFVSVMALYSAGGNGWNWLPGILMITGYLELLGMGVGFVGLVFVGLIAIGVAIFGGDKNAVGELIPRDDETIRLFPREKDNEEK